MGRHGSFCFDATVIMNRDGGPCGCDGTGTCSDYILKNPPPPPPPRGGGEGGSDKKLKIHS